MEQTWPKFFPGFPANCVPDIGKEPEDIHISLFMIIFGSIYVGRIGRKRGIVILWTIE